MSAMPLDDEAETSQILRYSMCGHSGDSDYIPFVRGGETPKNESERFMILQVKIVFRHSGNMLCLIQSIIQSMIAHTQFCASGDHTLEAIDAAITR